MCRVISNKKIIRTVLFAANDIILPLTQIVSRKGYTLTFVNENYLPVGVAVRFRGRLAKGLSNFSSQPNINTAPL